MTPSLRDRVKVWPQYLLPKHTLTALAWWLSNITWAPFKNSFIQIFVRLFKVNLSEAVSSDPSHYENFNAFFTRALKPNTRPLADAFMVSPSDGRISQLGSLTGPDQNQLIQAKGLDYTLTDLLGHSEGLERFYGGRFATIYLAPYDYHRVHVPAQSTLMRALRIPGELFSVSNTTALAIPRLYARNERLVCEYQTAHGPFMLVMVAALMVAGIETVWDNPSLRRVHNEPLPYFGPPIDFAKGQEMGRFHWGSTVILITPPKFPGWHPAIQPNQTIRLGQALTEQ